LKAQIIILAQAMVVIVIWFLPILSKSPVSASEIYKVYLPIVCNRAICKSVPEFDLPPNRWPNTPGQPLIIAYKWGAQISWHTEWKDAFQAGKSDWSEADTRVEFGYDYASDNFFDVDYDPLLGPGFTIWVIENEVVVKVKSYGNIYHDELENWSSNQRRSIAAHEVGHAQLIGHIPRIGVEGYAVMFSSHPPSEYEWLYSPTNLDIILVNQVYHR
ncbi:MAG: hypothetical protein U9R58_03110, partial [Chloroflexota bacterium]|nr:hypothetical protein [Chloroflexota bacterium]